MWYGVIMEQGSKAKDSDRDSLSCWDLDSKADKGMGTVKFEEADDDGCW